MDLIAPAREKGYTGLPLKVPDGARILIVCDDDSQTEQLQAVLREGGFILHCARNISDGCEAAKSGRFQVVISTPLLRDGSWKRLADIAQHYDLGFEVVLWALNFDSRERAEALNDGAFDFLDAVLEQSRAIETVSRGLWAAYLKGAGPHTSATPLKAA